MAVAGGGSRKNYVKPGLIFFSVTSLSRFKKSTAHSFIGCFFGGNGMGHT